MAMINTSDIVETIKMIEEEHLDIRTITMGISLRDLASDDIKVLSDKIYDKINTSDIVETIKMIEEEHLDIRTITMGISLRDLASDDIKVLSDKIYDKVTRRAEHLVATGEQIERELGIPIIHKRISVTPIAMIGATTNATSYVPIAQALDRAASTTGVNFVGGFSALVQKGFAKGDEVLIQSMQLRPPVSTLSAVSRHSSRRALPRATRY